VLSGSDFSEISGAVELDSSLLEALVVGAGAKAGADVEDVAEGCV